MVTLIIAVLLLWQKRRKDSVTTNSNLEEQVPSYSSLDRETDQYTQLKLSNIYTELYDQIKLSPSTGQSEPTTQSQSENTEGKTHIAHVSDTCYELLETEAGNYDLGMYAIVDRKAKRKESKQSQDNISEREGNQNESGHIEKPKHPLSKQQENLEEMYAVVHKKPQTSTDQEETAPPIPLHTVEALYTAVQKKQI